MQISSFAPLAPLSPTHRGGSPENESGGHGETTHGPVRITPTGVTDPQEALGPALPPTSLLPAVEGLGLPGTTSRSTEAGAATAELPGSTPADPEVAAADEDTTDSDPGTQELSEDEKQEVDELKARDLEVRQHEQAHMAAAGSHANGGPSYEYTKGPDGKRYATGGEVSIDTSKESDPEATIRKAQQIYRAALAPAEPSSQDRSVAAKAKQMETEARGELAEQRQEEAAQIGSGDETQAMGSESETDPARDAASPALGPTSLPGSGGGEEDEGAGFFVALGGPSGSATGGSTAANLLDLLA